MHLVDNEGVKADRIAGRQPSFSQKISCPVADRIVS